MAERSPLEKILTDRNFFGLKATPVQRAICRAIDGWKIPITAWDRYPDVRKAFKSVPPLCHDWKAGQPVGLYRPKEVVLLAGIRGAKSMMCAAMAWDRILNCDLSWWNPKEAEPILPVMSVRKHNAEAVFKHARGLAMHSPFKEHVVNITRDSIIIRHPATGANVTMLVTASSRAASSVASYWLVGCIFDEAPKMTGREESVLNLEDALFEVRERIVQGGQIMLVGSPWRPEGPVYRMVQESFGVPSEQRLVIRATGPMLNPKHWTEERCTRLEESQDAQDREIYRTSVLGEFLEEDESLLSLDEIESVTRVTPLDQPPIPGIEYVAAMDPATRRNVWTLVIAGAWEEHRVSIAVAKEWVPTGKSRLNPDDVIREASELLRRYNVTRVLTDGWSIDAMRVLAAQHGLVLQDSYSQGRNRFQELDAIRLAVQRGTVELPPLETLQRDLLRMTKRAKAASIEIKMPETNDGRHCDFAPPLAMVLAHPPHYHRALGPAFLPDDERYELELAAADKYDWLDGLAAQMN